MKSETPAEHPEEIVNAVTHAAGVAVAIAGSIVLLLTASRRGSAAQVVGCAVYAATLVLTYLFSTLSHVLRKPRSRSFMRAADQAAIFLFIAGTYTPLAVTWQPGGAWWLLTAAMWGLAAFGFLRKAVWTHRVELGTVSTILYVILGLLPTPLFFYVPAGLVKWILAGGICYFLGIVFFHYDNRVRYFHAAWHLLVIVGSVCHFIGIQRYCATGSVSVS